MWVAKSGSIATLATGFFVYLANFFPPLDTVFYSLPLPLGPHGGPLEFRYGQLFAIALILSARLAELFRRETGRQRAGGGDRVESGADRLHHRRRPGVRRMPHPPRPAPAAAVTFAGFIAALVAALWAYDGWNNVSMVASEIRDPQRNLPRALIWRNGWP